jgi:predicted phosphoribosyltransferase
MSQRSPDRFEDRTDAGRRLGEALAERGVDGDLVLAVPRGGLPVGRAVADALGLPLDVVVASKIGAPNNPELAVGAAASDGSVWVDEETVEALGVDPAYVSREGEREAEAAREKAERYRTDGPPDVSGRTVLVVDDGAATGSTAIAAVRLLRAQGAGRVVVALPVAPPETVEALGRVADEVVCLLAPRSFGAVGRFYRRFDQVSDEEAIAYLREGGSEG